MRTPGYILLTLLALLAVHPFAPAQQQTPPAPGPPRSVTIPAPSERTLANGLRVIVIEKRTIPLITAQLLIMNGGEVDPADQAGLAEMTAGLVTKGTETRTAPEIAEAIESLGGAIDSGAGWDASSVEVSVMTTRIAPALEILADVVRRPSFKEDEVERLRQQYLDNLRVQMQQPGSVASFTATRVVFGSGVYGHPLSGTLESVPRIRRADVVRLHQSYYRPDNSILVFGGDISRDHAFSLAQKHFGDWPKPLFGVPVRKAGGGSGTAGRRVVVVDMPAAGQAAVMVAARGIARTDPQYFTAIVANSVLGGGYSSRMNQEIRIKRGLSYGAGSSIDARRAPGRFAASAQTKNESAGEVVQVMLDQLGRLGKEPVAPSELTPRKAALIGEFGRSLETTDGLVRRLAGLALYGLSLDSLNRYVSQVEAVTAAQVTAFARKVLDPARTNIIVAGNAKLFLSDLRKAHPEAQVIPVDRLDLDSTGLLKK